jgi:methanogenic corrinoid protein MtbC1
MSIFAKISLSLQQGKAKVVRELVQKAIDEGESVKQILEDGLIAGMTVIGDKFKNNELYVPDVLIAARAMNAGTELLKPLLASSGVVAAGKVVIGTVKGDLHDIGKNLVKMMMEGKGLEVVDIGIDVPAEKFVEKANEIGAQIIACSALLTTTMPEIKNVIKAIVDGGIRDKVTIMIGGAPVTQAFCKEVGADDARDAYGAGGLVDRVEEVARTIECDAHELIRRRVVGEIGHGLVRRCIERTDERGVAVGLIDRIEAPRRRCAAGDLRASV